MRIGVPMETVAGERRVALVPDGVRALVGAGLEVDVEFGAGRWAHHDDAAYEAAGARLVADPRAEADLYLCVAAPSLETVDTLKPGSALVGLLQARTNPDLLSRTLARSITAFSLEMIPRIARAQSMDVLTSQATVAGYKAVLLGGGDARQALPMLMTAAGTIAPARVLVHRRRRRGAASHRHGATARRRGGGLRRARRGARAGREPRRQVRLTRGRQRRRETRAATRRRSPRTQQKRERQRSQAIVAAADIVITTALIPGRRAPMLVTGDDGRRHARRAR